MMTLFYTKRTGKKMLKKIVKNSLILLAGAVVAVVYYLNGALGIGTGYAAKYVCSQMFLAGRDAAAVFEYEVKPTHILFKPVKITIDKEKKEVTAAAFGFWKTMTAVYRENCGCTLMVDTTRQELLDQAAGITPRNTRRTTDPWPYGESVDLTDLPEQVNRAKLNKVLEDAFKEDGPQSQKNTQAIVVVSGDQIIAEKYGKGFDKDTPMLGWSMAKSVTSMLTGVLVKKGMIDIMTPVDLKEWKKPGDSREEITLDMLLRMSSGLEFEEEYAPFKDVVYMLYAEKSMADFAMAKPLAVPPDTEWNYSGGTTNIIARILRDKVGGTLASEKNYFNTHFFDKLGMTSAVIEADSSGSFVGSSYMYASARDWARVGLLVKNNGVWKDEQILPRGWVKYAATPTPEAPMGQYGAQFWLNAGDKDNPSNRTYPALPKDLIYFSGFNDQVVAVLPSKDLVVVRLGVTHDDSWSNEKFIKELIDAME